MKERRGCPPGAAVLDAAEVGGRGGRIGNPQHIRDEAIAAKVKMCAAIGMSAELTGQIVGLGRDCILAHYRPERENGLIEANMRVGAAIFQSAIGEEIVCVTCDGQRKLNNRMCVDCRGKGRVWVREPSPTSQIWWSKNQMGWTDQQRIEHVGAGGGPILTEQVRSGDRVRERLAGIREKLAPPANDEAE